MTYHTVCKSNEDFIDALRWARNISAEITYSLNHWPWHNVSVLLGGDDIDEQVEPDWADPLSDSKVKNKVFPYR